MEAEIFVRVGDPKSPLGLFDFDTVSDWKKAVTVSDLVWNEKKEEWVPRPKKVVGEMSWQGTYEAEIQFTPGKHLIDLKFVSPMKDGSVVFSNWEVNVK